MAESYFPMLPKIDEKSNKVLMDQSGIWKSTSLDFLQGLASSLAAGETLEDIGNIDSIPDVWAKPLLFKMALFDLETTREFVMGLHDLVLGEWRAILAMLALKNVKQINLKAVSVNLTEINSEMSSVLKALAPKESFNGNADAWLTDIYVIFYNEFPIALTSPSTLVATAADYTATFRGQLDFPWSKNKINFCDPIKFLSKDELLALKSWLKNLYGELQNISQGLSGNSQDIAINLLKCVKNYQDDVTRELGAQNSDVTLNLVQSNLNLHMGISRLLDKTVQGREVTAEDSAVKLLVNSSRSNKKLLLISPEMVKAFARQEGTDPARLFIWQGVSANDITEKALQGERNKIGQISLKNTEFRRPEDFFYEQMAVVEPGNAFPGSLEISGAIVLADDALTPILPIKRELLEIFTPQDIVSRLSISEDNENILLNFNFPLSGTNGGGVDFRFTKAYPKRDLIYIQQEVPVIEIWPNIRRKDWDKYYLYYENYQAQATGKGAADVLVDEMYYVEPFTFGQKLGEDFPAQGLKNCFTAKLNNFPEALICNYKTANSATEVGMVLLDSPELVRKNVGLTWKIGVDFGTSSTMLYYREGNKQPSPLDFAPHLFQVTESGGARSQTFINFIASNPPAGPDGSFLSIFHLLNISNTSQEIRPLQDGHVLSFINRDIFNRLGHRVDANLKWKNDSLGRRKVAAYVRQICLQALVEAAARGVDDIQWNFSYPTAFSQEQKLAFETTCREGIKEAYSGTGLKIDIDKDIEIWSESKASAYYFNKFKGKGVAFTDGAICIDIGAGTTDISVISGQPGRIVYHTSVQYAGRYMFKPIFDNYELFATIKNDKDDSRKKTIEDIKSMENGEQRDALIDTDMRLHSEEYIKDLAYKTGQESVKSVLQGVQFATAGLFYYLGQLLGILHETGHYQEDKLPDIYVGGNSSRIFTWLVGGTNIDGNPYLNVLEKMLADASGLEKNRKFNLKFSHYPKVEVVCGMVTDKPNNDSEFFDEVRINKDIFQEDAKDEYICNSVLAGAEFIEGNEKIESDSFVGANEMSDGIRVTSINEFKKFVACFNEAPKLWLEGIPLDYDSEEELIKNTNSFYVALKGEDKKKIFVEPVFIVELKNLMEMVEYGE